MDGDRSRFLIRLVMVDPSTAIMMKSPGTVLALSWDLFQQQHCPSTPQSLPVCLLTDLRWQRPPYLLQLLSLGIPLSPLILRCQALHYSLQCLKDRPVKRGVKKLWAVKKCQAHDCQMRLNWRDGWTPSRASGWLVWSPLIPNCSHGNCCAQGRRPPGSSWGGRGCWAPVPGAARTLSVLWPGNPFCHGSLPPPPLNLWSSLLALHRDPGPFSSTSLRSPCYSPAPPFGPSLTSPGARGPRRSQRPQASRSTISAPRPRRQQQLWWHERLKTRTTAWAKLRAG